MSIKGPGPSGSLFTSAMQSNPTQSRSAFWARSLQQAWLSPSPPCQLRCLGLRTLCKRMPPYQTPFFESARDVFAPWHEGGGWPGGSVGGREGRSVPTSPSPLAPFTSPLLSHLPLLLARSRLARSIQMHHGKSGRGQSARDAAGCLRIFRGGIGSERQCARPCTRRGPRTMRTRTHKRATAGH